MGIDWLVIRSGETIVVTGKDAGTYKGQQLLCGYIKQKPERGFGLFPNSVIRILRDKMNPLGERRFWGDLQEEKRDPAKVNKPVEDAQLNAAEEEKVVDEVVTAQAEAVEEVEPEQKEDPEQDDAPKAPPATEAPLTEAHTQPPSPPSKAAPADPLATEAPTVAPTTTTQAPTKETTAPNDPIDIVQEAEKAELERLKSLEEEELKDLRPLQKTSQIWRWIDDMLDEKFVERLVLTLHDEQSALLLLVSARMAYQKSQNNEELTHFNQLAKEVSTYVEEAHGIGKRRDAKTPPTMSQLSVVAHSVVQLLLEPHSAQLYFDNKKVYPTNLAQVQIKYGVIDDPAYVAEEEEQEQQQQQPDEQYDPLLDDAAFGEYDDLGEYADYEQDMLGLDEADYEQIDKEIEIDLLHDIEQIVENDQVEDAADAVVDQVIAETYRDNDEILVGDVTNQEHHQLDAEMPDQTAEQTVDYDDGDEELAREIREAEAKIEELKAKKTTPAPPQDELEHHQPPIEEHDQRMEFEDELKEPEPTFEILDNLETIEFTTVATPVESGDNINDLDNENNFEIIEPDHHQEAIESDELKNETDQNELNKKYQAQVAEQSRQDRFNEVYYRQNMLCKILMTFGSCFDAVFGRLWPGLILFTVFTIYLVKHTMASLSDNGVTERCHAVQEQLKKARQGKVETESKANESTLQLQRAQQETTSIQNDIARITTQITQLKEWETQFESFLTEQRTLSQNYRENCEQLETDRTRLDHDIHEAYQKQHSLNDEKNRDIQALSDIESMKHDRQEDVTRSKVELDQMKGENGRLETEIKKAKLVAANYAAKLKETDQTSGQVTQRVESSKKKLAEAEKKEVNVRNALLELKTVYQWLEANANITGESAEEIMLNQQDFLLQSIRLVPELNDAKKQTQTELGKMTSQLEKRQKIFSSQEEKIKLKEYDAQAEANYVQLKEDVEKLEAELDVTQDYYAKREMEISMQLGTEAGSRVQSEELHSKQMAKENRLKEKLDKLKEQVSTLEKKWEVEDTHHTATVGVSEENRSRNQFALMESEAKHGQIVVRVRELRGKVNDVDDRVEQAEEYMGELNDQEDFELSNRRSENGKDSTQSESSSKDKIKTKPNSSNSRA